jgi:hypothetical protein
MEVKLLLDEVQNNADVCHKEMVRLVNIFNRIRPGKEFAEMKDNIDLAYNVVGTRVIIECISEYMLYFKQDIINGDVDKIYNFKYETLIAKNTLSKTQNLILTLVNSMRTIWDISNEKQQENITKSIRKLLLYCIKNEKYMAQMKHI